MSQKQPSLVKIALLGCGSVSELYYAPALKELEKHKMVRVESLIDPNPARASRLKSSFPEAIPHTQMESLDHTSVDLAIVASPPQFHAEQAIWLLKRGIPVLCEKPLAIRVQDAEAMIAAARTSNRLLAVGQLRRFFPCMQAIQHILSQGLLGRVKHLICQEGGIFRWPVQSASYFSKAAGQGGVLLDLGIHVLDLIIWWWGYPESYTYQDDAMGGVEANCRIQLEFNQGITGEVRLSRDCPLPNRCVIECEKGWISCLVNEPENIEIGFNESELALAAGLYQASPDARRFFRLGPQSPTFEQIFLAQLSNVVAAVQGREPLKLPAEISLPALKLIEACYQKRSFMHMPWMTESETQRALHLREGGE